MPAIRPAAWTGLTSRCLQLRSTWVCCVRQPWPLSRSASSLAPRAFSKSSLQFKRPTEALLYSLLLSRTPSSIAVKSEDHGQLLCRIALLTGGRGHIPELQNRISAWLLLHLNSPRCGKAAALKLAGMVLGVDSLPLEEEFSCVKNSRSKPRGVGDEC